MAAPTGLTIKNNLADMQIGDCIPCRYTALTSGQAGVFSELGVCTASEIPITGTATPDGLFYLIKVDKGTFIADRVIQTNISWDVLNTAKLIEGKSTILGGINTLIHSLFGGSAYTDSNNGPSTTDKLLGAWPPNNEWDKYIVNSDLKGKITKGDDNVWHWSKCASLCKDTPLTSVTSNNNVTGANTGRVARSMASGAGTTNKSLLIYATSTTASYYGFRPVLNYVESDIASEVIY